MDSAEIKFLTRVRIPFVLIALAVAVLTLASPAVASNGPSIASSATSGVVQPLATSPTGFVRGMYGKDSSHSGFDLMAGLGFNTVMTGPYPQLLDPVATKGLEGIVWLGNWLNAPTCKFERNDATITTQVTAVAKQRAILAYYLGDEPHVSECPQAPAMFKKRTELVHSLAPGSVTFTVIQQSENGTVRNYAPWAGAVDVIGFDIYPCSKASSSCNFGAIDAAIAAIEGAGIKRYWAIIQDFQDCYYRLPTPQELRAQYDHWARSNMSGYLVFSWNYQSVDSKCVGTNLENHPDNIAELKYENSRTFVPQPAQPPSSLISKVIGIGRTSSSPGLLAVSIASVLLIGIAIVALLLLRRRRKRRLAP
jgi:hypothetical protein